MFFFRWDDEEEASFLTAQDLLNQMIFPQCGSASPASLRIVHFKGNESNLKTNSG